MDEQRFQLLADETFRKIEDLLEPVDPDLADYEMAGDVLHITFADGSKCVVNPQRPTRQIWMAAHSRAWHFDWNEERGAWLDEKDPDTELFAHLRALLKDTCGVDLGA
ncbi:MAG TPA: iron donor protein CyaY [Vulgatibacter sp.]|nr:iron donor protein CyaY [Vulgatibacter sp.]